jgi:ATP-dependent Clp protease protease subunit
MMSATITLTGDVGFEISYQGFIDTLESRGIASDDDLVIKLFSPGGEVFEAEMIFSEIKRRKGRTTCYVDSLAASAASLIAVAADELIMGPNAYLMIHKPFTVMQGNSTRLRSRLKTLEELESRYVAAYRSKTGNKLSEKFILELMSANEGEGSYLTAEEAVEFGLADRIDEQLAAARIIPLNREAEHFKNPPMAIAAKLKRVLKPHEQDDLLRANLEAVRQQRHEPEAIEEQNDMTAEAQEEITASVEEPEAEVEVEDEPVAEAEVEDEPVAEAEVEDEPVAEAEVEETSEEDEVVEEVVEEETAEADEPEEVEEIEETLAAKSEAEVVDPPRRDIVAELRARLEKPAPTLKSV